MGTDGPGAGGRHVRDRRLAGAATTPTTPQPTPDLLTPVESRAAPAAACCTFKAQASRSRPATTSSSTARSTAGPASPGSDGVTGTTGGAYRSFELALTADGQSSVVFGFGLESNGSGTAPTASTSTTSPSGQRPGAGRHPSFQFLDGTSMATPHVAGAAALLLGQQAVADGGPAAAARCWTPATRCPRWPARRSTGRRLNVNNAIRSPLLVVHRARPARARASRPPAPCSTASSTRTATATSWLSSTARRPRTAPRPRPPTRALGSDQAVAAAIGGLPPSTTYHYRLVAVRGGDRFPGADATFTTAPAACAAGRRAAGRRRCHSRARQVRPGRMPRKRGKYRCRVSLTRGSSLRARLCSSAAARCSPAAAAGSARLITLQGQEGQGRPLHDQADADRGHQEGLASRSASGSAERAAVLASARADRRGSVDGRRAPMPRRRRSSGSRSRPERRLPRS